MQALQAGNALVLLDVPAPYGSVQLQIAGGGTILDTAGPFAMGPASHWCDECYLSVDPIAVPDSAAFSLGRGVVGTHENWILYPCHEHVCEGCNHLESENATGWCHTCDHCHDCCACWHCAGCSETFSSDRGSCESCNYCSHCCECYWCDAGEHKIPADDYCCNDHCVSHCSCQPDWDVCGCGDASCPENARSSSNPYRASGGTVPGWIRRGDELPSDTGSHHDLLADHISRLDPAREMATFYVCDYIGAVLPGSQLARDAKRIQDQIIRDCDDAFRDYVYCAIGGEVRHHQNVRGTVPSSRETCWSYWIAMGDSIGRATLLADAVELFADGSWSSSFGGARWAQCARIALKRETGELDARTYVDRVFSLQHNGGSLLNKSEWRGGGRTYVDTSTMVAIGNAHAADDVDLGQLISYASRDARTLLYAMPTGAVRNTVERAWLENWHSWCDGTGEDQTSWAISPRQSDELSRELAAAMRDELERVAMASDRAAYVLELVRTGASWCQQYPDETSWTYNARLHAMWENMT